MLGSRSGSECACRGSSVTQSARGWCRRPSGGSRGVPGGSRGRRRCRFRRREWRSRPGRARGPVGLGPAAGDRAPHGWPRRPNGAAERPGASGWAPGRQGRARSGGGRQIDQIEVGCRDFDLLLFMIGLDGLAGAMWRRARPPGRGTSSASDANGKCFATGSVGSNTTPIIENSNHSHTRLYLTGSVEQAAPTAPTPISLVHNIGSVVNCGPLAS